MSRKILNRRSLAKERCSRCEYGKLEKTIDSVYGLKFQKYKCYAKSKRGRKVEGELYYSCPIGKQLNLDES